MIQMASSIWWWIEKGPRRAHVEVYEAIKGSTIRFTCLIYGMHDYYSRLVCSIADYLVNKER